ncbi:MAG: hypothetical protein AAFX50_04475, partial [Acidobacteriota bacterium]
REAHRIGGAATRDWRVTSKGHLVAIPQGSIGSKERLAFYDPPATPGERSALRAEVEVEGRPFFGGEPSPGRLLVTVEGPRFLHGGRFKNLRRFSAPTTVSWRTLLLDVETATVERTIDGRAALPGTRRPGDQGADWLLDARGFPLRLNPDNGALEPLLGP